MKDQAMCPDCAPAPVSHRVAYWSVFFDWLLEPLERVSDFLYRRLFLRVWYALGLYRSAPIFVRFIASLPFVKLSDELRFDDNFRTKCLWEAATARGIQLQRFVIAGRPTLLFVATRNGDTYVFDTLPRPHQAPSRGLGWMDDKPTMRRKFAPANIPVAQGAVCFRRSRALQTFHAVSHPVITKPSFGSRSRHTTVDIQNQEELLGAFRKAKALSPFVVIEQQLKGSLFRATVIGGAVVGVVRRDPPYVIGDGSLTIRQLVDTENTNPTRHGPIFHELDTGLEALHQLTRQNLTWDSVPAAGRFVSLNQKTSRGLGGTTTDVTDVTHPENLMLFQKVAELLGDPLVGIDMIIETMEQPWSAQQPCGIIECNSYPFLDLHDYPFQGQSRDAAGKLWELVFMPSTITHSVRNIKNS